MIKVNICKKTITNLICSIMKTKYLISTFILIFPSFFVYSQAGGSFKITKATIDNGGGQSFGGSFSINTTTGQADASSDLSGGNFSLKGGFWTISKNLDIIFKDNFEGYNL